MNRLRRLLALPRSRQALLFKCASALLLAAWQVRKWPFSRLAASLGTPTPPPAVPRQPALVPADPRTGEARAADVRWAVGAWARVWPWQPTCLMQAVAARRLLVERGVPCDLFFGVRGQRPGEATSAPEIGAHAWLRCGDMIVTGEAEAARFQPIAVYRYSPPVSSSPT